MAGHLGLLPQQLNDVDPRQFEKLAEQIGFAKPL